MSDQPVRVTFDPPRKVTETPDAYFFVNPSGEDLMLPKTHATPFWNEEGLSVAVSMTAWIASKRVAELEGLDVSGNATDTTRFQEQDVSEMTRQDWYELFLTAAFLVRGESVSNAVQHALDAVGKRDEQVRHRGTYRTNG